MTNTVAHSISADAIKPLDSQVGGHPGVMTTEGGALIIKPALPVELAFYQTVKTNPVFARLRPFIPQCIGTLRLEGEATPDGTSLKPSIVLENLAHPFVKPNILDIKLGTVLYDEFASQEKKERMEKTARETTSLETGVRLTGFQVHDNITGEPVNTPKSYGKTIKPSDLPDGIARFFPVGSLPPSNPNSTYGLPKDTILKVLKLIVEDIQEIKDVMAELEIRMAGGSLLVIYEADWERVEEGLKKLDEDEDEDDDDDDDEAEEEEGKKLGPPFVVRVIDFAHTHHVSDRGPDESVLKGLDTTLSLLRGRIEQISKE